MPLTLLPIGEHFVARASGLDLTRPLTPNEVQAVNEAMDRYAVLVFSGLRLSGEQQLAFAQHFGELDVGLNRLRPGQSRLKRDDLIDISNVDATGSLAARDSAKLASNYANQLWHSDSSFQRPKAQYSMLHAVVLPDRGGETEFADLRGAYDRLPADLKTEVDGLVAEHWALHSRNLLGDMQYSAQQEAMFPPVHWPLVQIHPTSGRKLLFVGAHARAIAGMPTSEARLLLSDLLEHATRHEFVYRHTWQVGDLVIWDNRCTVHRGRRFPLDQRRELRRTTLNDESSRAQANPGGNQGRVSGSAVL